MAKVKKGHKAESVSYFSTRNLLATVEGGAHALDDPQPAAQTQLVMMVLLTVAAQLGLTQPVHYDQSARGLSPLNPVTASVLL